MLYEHFTAQKKIDLTNVSFHGVLMLISYQKSGHVQEQAHSVARLRRYVLSALIITVLCVRICWFVPVVLHLSEIIGVSWSWPCRALWEICPAESLHWSIGTWRARTCRRSLPKVRPCCRRPFYFNHLCPVLHLWDKRRSTLCSGCIKRVVLKLTEGLWTALQAASRIRLQGCRFNFCHICKKVDSPLSVWAG